MATGLLIIMFIKFIFYVTNRPDANLKLKIPEMETSLALVRNLQKKRDEKETVVTRYSLADDVYGKAELDLDKGSVNLWLGASKCSSILHDISEITRVPSH